MRCDGCDERVCGANATRRGVSLLLSRRVFHLTMASLNDIWDTPAETVTQASSSAIHIATSDDEEFAPSHRPGKRKQALFFDSDSEGEAVATSGKAHYASKPSSSKPDIDALFDDLDDPEGCIFTQNLLVPDATEAEIKAAVAGVSSGNNNAAATRCVFRFVRCTCVIGRSWKTTVPLPLRLLLTTVLKRLLR